MKIESNIIIAIKDLWDKYPLVLVLIVLLLIDSFFAHKRLKEYSTGLEKELPDFCQDYFIEYDNHFFNSSPYDDFQNEF